MLTVLRGSGVGSACAWKRRQTPRATFCTLTQRLRHGPVGSRLAVQPGRSLLTCPVAQCIVRNTVQECRPWLYLRQAMAFLLSYGSV
jgi:hypothetical protein